MTQPTLKINLQNLAAEENLVHPPRSQRTGKATKRVKLPLALRRAAQDALTSFRASADHQDLVASLPTLNLEQAHTCFSSVLQGPYFAPLMQRLRAPAELESDPLDFIPKAVSFGIMGQIVVGVGASGSVGAVANINPMNAQLGIYAGGAVDFGFDIGIQGDFCVGFWLNAVDDIAGLYIGGEVDVDDGTGFDVAAFLQDGEPALAFVGVDFGLDDGIENEDFYFCEFDVTTPDPTIYQPGNATYLVQLNTLTCVNSKDNYDTVYFNFQQDGNSSVTYRYPAWDGYQMCESDRDSTYSKWGVGMIAKFNSSLTLILQVGNYTMPSQTITSSNFSGLNGTTTLTFKDYTDVHINEIEYTLTLRLIKN